MRVLLRRLSPADAGIRLRLAALERSPGPMVITAPDGRQVYANRSARELRAELDADCLGITPGDLESGAVSERGEPLPSEQLPTQTTRLTGRPCTHAEIALPTRMGPLRWLRVSTRPLGGDGPPYGVVTSYERVPEPLAALHARTGASRRGSEASNLHFDGRRGPPEGDPEALRQARQQFSTAFSRAPIGMALVSPGGRWLRVNQALCELVGYSEPELLARRFQDITHPDDLDAQLALVGEMLAGHRAGYQMDKRYLHADGRTIWVSISVSLVSDEAGEPLHLITQVLDITDRHHTETRLQHLADHDPLTGVLNRRRFEEEIIRQLDRCRRYGEQATLVMIDVDHLKEVNDTLGHAAGDDVLRAIASALLGKVRSSDVLARLGGDEFGAILVGVADDQALAAGQALASVVREQDETDELTTVSVGATVLTPDDQPDLALVRADTAMYRLKSRGGDGAELQPAPMARTSG